MLRLFRRTRRGLLTCAIFGSLTGASLFAFETLATWRSRYFSPEELASPLSSDLADANNDGAPNLIHYAFGLSPHRVFHYS